MLIHLITACEYARILCLFPNMGDFPNIHGQKNQLHHVVMYIVINNYTEIVQNHLSEMQKLTINHLNSQVGHY